MRIILTGGGTLGSVTPLLAIAEELTGEKFLWIGTRHGPERAVVEATGISFCAISAGKLRRYFSLQTFFEPWAILRGFFQAFGITLSFKPQVIASAGGYVAFPVILAGRLLGVPAVIHQQDIRPGLANLFSARFATKITASFEKTARRFRQKTEVIGNPVRRAIEEIPAHRAELRRQAHKFFGLDPMPPVVLVIGGGTGARRLNWALLSIRTGLSKDAQVIHVTGTPSPAPDADRYHQYEFLVKEMPLAYAAADLVISRAGMGAITEIAAAALPAIFVPLPGTHQEENASFLDDAGAAVICTEGLSFHHELLRAVHELLADKRKRDDLGSRLHRLFPGSARGKLAEIVRAAARR